MRKSSVQLVTQTSEPLIVVDELGEPQEAEQSECSSSEESPTAHFQSQFLLSPWRDARETRKLSLPSPQCSGITASQVRRLSERGGDSGGGPGPRQTEFLATLSQAPAPTPGGRRHSVVTISKVPPSLFGRNRRESVAAFPSRVLAGSGSRRESMTGPPSTEPRGSVHNLQLDIMDDIVQSRKVRMKLWNTSSEKVCELKDETTGAVHKYTSGAGGAGGGVGGGSRRYSDFVGTTLAPIPSCSKRRASELPQIKDDGGGGACKQPPAAGIVCSNTDLISILSHLTSSATDINQQAAASTQSPPVATGGSNAAAGRPEMKGWEARRARLRAHRSNSFDASVLHQVERAGPGGGGGGSAKTPSDWFAKRHQPMAAKTGRVTRALTTSATFADELEARRTQLQAKPPTERRKHKVLWDENSGSVVDAQVLGNAIEDFLRRDSQLSLLSPQPSTATAPSASPPGGGSPGASKGAVPKRSPQQPAASTAPVKPKGWFGTTSSNNAPSADGKCDGDGGEAPAASCESSICATLKDLFVK